MRLLSLNKKFLDKRFNTFLMKGVFLNNSGSCGIPTQSFFSTFRTVLGSNNEFNKVNGSKFEGLSDRRFFTYKTEATCTRKVYGEDDKVTVGPPTYTIFSPEVCLTVKVKKDELTGDNSLLLTGMTRMKDGTNGFNKNSRISSLLPLDTLNKLNEAVKTNSKEPVTFEGLDGGSVVVTNNSEKFSIKLYPSLLPGLNLSPGMMPNLTNKGKSHIDFTGTNTEQALVVHALHEISVSV